MLSGSAKEKAHTRNVLKASRKAKKERRLLPVCALSSSSPAETDLIV